MSFRVTRDTLTPALARMAAECKNPQGILKAMGQELVSLTQGAFNDASLRPEFWPPTKTGHAPLKAGGALFHSIRITGISGNEVRVGTDRPYAVYQQFGTSGPYEIKAKIKKALHWGGKGGPTVKSVMHPGLPPRPFFPFDSQGNMLELARERIHAAVEKKLESYAKG